ncbi:MinD/ParA family protein [Anoxybacillus sp. J5B_2022]|uniref:MinD/ParA family protein n=1 Tax=Anoxybacillus sp. J5B_2022 TaxID=3003246 RepID=UPI002285AD81|nr:MULTISPECIES: MinD/ParA family protein [unclassified Anoxybacillus]MCL6586011.1 MinD/ParA family protein [Anoxybacillus sp.]MCZ0755291.1 MinD/ParA family protein [Anoxybacillus sp. J5B_2022]
MRDQAESLRLRLSRMNKGAETKAIAVISGKGGVGKSNFSLNFALSLSNRGFHVLLFDMDIGMGNIDILLGQSSQTTIIDLFQRRISIQELIRKGPGNLSFISGGTGLAKLFAMDNEKVDYFLEQLQSVSTQYDYFIFDMGAGMSEDRLRLLMAVHEIFVITTPEPTAIMDAYAAMKYIHLQEKKVPFYVIVNRAQTDQEGRDTLQRLKNAMKQFLGKDVTKLGILPEDRTVSKAVTSQTPFLLFDPATKISRAMNELVERYLANRTFDEATASRPANFFARLRQFLLER